MQQVIGKTEGVQVQPVFHEQAIGLGNLSPGQRRHEQRDEHSDTQGAKRNNHDEMVKPRRRKGRNRVAHRGKGHLPLVRQIGAYRLQATIGSASSPLCIQRRPSFSIRSIAFCGPHVPGAYCSAGWLDCGPPSLDRVDHRPGGLGFVAADEERLVADHRVEDQPLIGLGRLDLECRSCRGSRARPT